MLKVSWCLLTSTLELDPLFQISGLTCHSATRPKSARLCGDTKIMFPSLQVRPHRPALLHLVALSRILFLCATDARQVPGAPVAAAAAEAATGA